MFGQTWQLLYLSDEPSVWLSSSVFWVLTPICKEPTTAPLHHQYLFSACCGWVSMPTTGDSTRYKSLLLKVGPGARSTGITGELVRNAESWAAPQTSWIRICDLTRSPGDCFRKHWHRYSPRFEEPTLCWGAKTETVVGKLRAEDQMHGPEAEDSRVKVGSIHKSGEEAD